MDGKTMEDKILVNKDRFVKFANVFHCQRFTLYSIVLSQVCMKNTATE